MSVRPIKIAVMALGGQGGGVLADWIVKAGERSGFIAQTTSVPGVAQRTGATIYYVELFPKLEAESNHAAPILALMPAPGDVDIVIASEMMEAGRALARGFVSKETTLIASTHRTYAIGEKVALGDGRQDAEIVRKDVNDKAGRAIWFDMEKAAEETGAVISAVLLGALAGSGAAPIGREIFEEEIRKSGRAVEKNIAAFSLGLERAKTGAPPESGEPHRDRHESAAPAVAPLLKRLLQMPDSVQKFAKPGLKRVVDFQDARYGALYLDRLKAILDVDKKNGGGANDFTLTANVAKYLAVAMAYDDVIRVADMKTRAERFHTICNEVRAGDAQIVRVFEFMHPRIEEAADLAPPAIARWMLSSSSARRLFGAMLGKGRRVATTNLSGFFLLTLLSSLKPVRRVGSRYKTEQARIEKWLSLISTEAARDYAFASEIAKLQRLIKGYSDTHARSIANVDRIIGALDSVREADRSAATLAKLNEAALKDENGLALTIELERLGERVRAA